MVTRPDEVPLPAAVAARPRDERGYPVPAITPWPDGTPAFAQQSAFRTAICLAERRCTVCGTMMPRGPVYRPVDEGYADLIGLALDTGKLMINAAPAMEGPGHRSCMIYSAIVCPHLASPGARRKIETHIGPETLPRGDPRGSTGGVAGFDGYSWKVDEDGLGISFGQPVELLRYTEGTDLAGELDAEISRERGTVVQPCPAYLLDDDARAERAAKAILTRLADGDTSQAPARQREQARKNQRKTAKAARRKNRR